MSESHNPRLVREQYATHDNLKIRQEIHEQYTVPQVHFPAWAIERLDLDAEKTILDVGCGTGIYHKAIMETGHAHHYVGIDLSTGMLAEHEARDRVASADVLQLPFANDSFDVIMANHMLYHVSDIDAAITEIHRILKPGGVVMAATNSIHTMPELQVLMRRAIVLLTRHGPAQVRAPALPSDDFALENGSRILAKHFYAVVRHDLPNTLVFPDVEPAMAYLESTRNLREAQLPQDVVWEDVMMIMRQQINQLIKHLGELVINKQIGVLLASDNGGFVRGFVQAQNGIEVNAP